MFHPRSRPYKEAHGLYVRKGKLKVVSPGDRVPRRRRWSRLGSLDHPGVARAMIQTPEGSARLVREMRERTIHGLSGQGQGVDISEFQNPTPGGFSFYILRLLNENNREDVRWRQHKAAVDSWGVPSGAYGIIRPGAADPASWAHHFADLLDQKSWAFVPTIDVELGDAGANRAFVAVAAPILRQRGYPVVMGYFSIGSAYRSATQDLFERWWGACWGCGYPAGFHVHQWSGSPLDRDYCPNYEAISQGGGGQPPPTPATQNPGVKGMLLRNKQNGAIYLVGPGHAHHVATGDEVNRLRFVGVPLVEVDNGLVIVGWGRTFGVPGWDQEATWA